MLRNSKNDPIPISPLIGDAEINIFIKLICYKKKKTGRPHFRGVVCDMCLNVYRLKKRKKKRKKREATISYIYSFSNVFLYQVITIKLFEYDQMI